MNIVFCHPSDRDAIWLYLELKKQGVAVQILAPEQLLMAREWTQSLGDRNDEFVVTTRDGTTIKSGEVRFFFNRAQFVDAPIWRRAREGDREYVRSEMTAMLMSWLHQVQQECLMINPPFDQSLCGTGWSEARWAKAAFEAGFQYVASAAQHQEGERVLVVGDHVTPGSESKEIASRCIRLAQIARSPLLEVRVGNSGNIFVSATAMPAFQDYGKGFLSLLHPYLSGDMP
jgi:hypothetical protein